MTTGRIAIVSATFPDLTTAERIGAVLVEERLAACCNAAACRSVYRWQGVLESADEVVAVFKTVPALAPALAERLTVLHPYELPATEWVEATTSSAIAD